MAFSSFANSSNALLGGAAGGAAGLSRGADLEIVSTEGLGFLAIAGDAKVQLTPRWSPAPAPAAQLLSIASRKGIVAAAGPDAIYISTTEAVRKAFTDAKNGDSEVRPYDAQIKLALPLRVSQLAFTADEKYLVISAEVGGGLAVYDVQSLLSGSTQPAFELGTNGETLRALAPNPMPESASLCAAVTNNGNLLMANLNDRVLVAGPNGAALRSQVICVSWSTRGKQLVAGMGDGTIRQMTPAGVDKGAIPKPANLGDYHVASLTWLENNLFLAVYNGASPSDPSEFNIITRQLTPPAFTFNKLTDPVEPWNLDKQPHHTVLRLKDFPPNLQDWLLVSSTSVESIGILTRSKIPLDSSKPAEKITGVFTTTELGDDSKRALLPMGDDLTETFPIGVALDLSSKEQVYKPIPTDEIDMSPTPLPGYWALNNEGVLASWYLVYNESIRAGLPYPGLAVVESSASAPASNVSAAPALGSPSPGPAPALTAASGSPFRAVQNTIGSFGSSASTGTTFGGPSTLGAKQSPWANSGTSTALAFGQSSFGGGSTTSAPALAAPASAPFFGAKSSTPAFGQSTGMGMANKSSPWGTGTSSATPAFGQSGFAGANPGTSKVFSGATSGGFAGFAGQSAFGSLGGGASGGTSIFGSKTPNTSEVSKDAGTAFPPPSANAVTGSTFGSAPFVLGSTFKPDPAGADGNTKPGDSAGGSLFGSGFGLSLTSAAEQATATTAMDEHVDDASSATPAWGKLKSVFDTATSAQPKSIFGLPSTTPTTTPASDKFGFKPTAGPPANPFAAATPSGGNSSIFGIQKTGSSGLFRDSSPLPWGTPKAKQQQDEDKENPNRMPQAPLPPDSTSKAPYPLGDISSSSSMSTILPDTESEGTAKPTTPLAEETHKRKPEPEPEPAPLPPDFISLKPKPAATLESAPLPPDFSTSKRAVPPRVPSVPDSDEDDVEGEDDEHEGESEVEEDDEVEEGEITEGASEGSGIDVAKDLSPSTSGLGGQTPGFTPQSSFGGMAGSTFSITSRAEPQPQQRNLFGEVGRNVPPLPRPVPQSPRSPSPVRGPQPYPSNMLRFESSRSVSAPGMASQLLGRSQQAQKTARPPPPTFAQTVDPNVEEQRRLAARRQAEAQAVLEDPEDVGIQQLLRSDVEPTLQMNEFIAGDSVPELRSGKGRESVPEACEALWRDMNHMIDRLGLNSRSLKSFILGHSTMVKDSGRSKADLENPDDWVLVEAADLGMVIEHELASDLEHGRVKKAEETTEHLQNLARDLARLRAKEEDLRKSIASHLDTDQTTVAKSLPLSAEQAAQQNELRKAYQAFTQLLVEAEENLTILKAKIASAGGGGDKVNGRTAVPTVDAIIRTINKMTSMAEKRSGDVDVLETQMRRLRMGIVDPDAAASTSVNPTGPRNREGSPFVGGTPRKGGGHQHRRSLMMSPPERGSLALRESFASSVASSRGVMTATPPRRKMSNYTEEEKQAVRSRQNRRGAMFGLLKASLERNGPNVQRLQDDD